MRTYTEQELIAFGNAMLSKPNDENRQSGVTDADVANFNAELKRLKDLEHFREVTLALDEAFNLLKGLFKSQDGTHQGQKDKPCTALLTQSS